MSHKILKKTKRRQALSEQMGERMKEKDVPSLKNMENAAVIQLFNLFKHL